MLQCCSAKLSHDLIGRPSQTATRCYNYWWWGCIRIKKQKQTVDTKIYAEPSCAIHLNRGNKLRVVLTSFNHGGNWCIFLQLQASSGEGAFVSVLFFPSSLLIFYSHHLPHVALADNRLQTRGRKRQEESKRCDKKGKALGETKKNKTETNTRTLKAEQLGVKVEEWRNK